MWGEAPPGTAVDYTAVAVYRSSRRTIRNPRYIAQLGSAARVHRLDDGLVGCLKLADLARMRRAALTRNERLEPALIESFRAP